MTIQKGDPGTTGTHHIDGSICDFAYTDQCDHWSHGGQPPKEESVSSRDLEAEYLELMKSSTPPPEPEKIELDPEDPSVKKVMDKFAEMGIPIEGITIEGEQPQTIEARIDPELKAAAEHAAETGDIQGGYDATIEMARRDPEVAAVMREQIETFLGPEKVAEFDAAVGKPNIQAGLPTPAEQSLLARMAESGDLTKMPNEELFELASALFPETAFSGLERIVCELLDRALTENDELRRQAKVEVAQSITDLGSDEEKLEFLAHVLNSCAERLSETTEEHEHGSVAELLSQIDPRDSEAALAMLDWLETYGRLNRVGTLYGGQGYMYVYKEPKGTTKAGYVPGGTQGGRLVDEAVDKARASGAKPKKTGLCTHCLTPVWDDEGVIRKDDPEAEGDPDFAEVSATCMNSGDGKHEMA